MVWQAMLIKICGITRVEDARAAVDAGARALGFVFWRDSPRFIDPYRARRIVSTLPAFVTPVGLFVNQPLEFVTGVATLVRLGAVQLHGDETVEYAKAVHTPVIKALTIGGIGIDAWPERVTLLLDAHDPARRGGTGVTIDWSAAQAIAERRRVLLAGGLTPDNVAEAIARVRPYGVDVSSGVERSAGVKDHDRMKSFCEAVHATSHFAPRS
jgi:phosphoribosylanthranilate isomerase